MSATPTLTASPIVLTAAGRRWLEARLERLADRLARVDADLAADRTAELLERRQQLSEQHDELATLLQRAVAPGAISDDPSLVEVGDEVDVRFPDESTETFLVVHPIEAGMDEHRTSMDSPLAQAVLGHRVGDRVTVTAPGGVYHAVITDRRRSN